MRRLFAGMVAAALVGAVAACGSSGGSGTSGGGDEVDQVKVGVIPIVDVAPIYLGKEKGFFTNRRIELTMESGQGGAAIVPGVVSGQFQFGFSNVTSLMVALTKNVPIKAIANGVASTGKAGADFGGVLVAKDSPIKTAKDLAGKKIAVNTLKNIGDTSVRESVRKAGGDPSRTSSFVEMPLPANAGRAGQGPRGRGVGGRALAVRRPRPGGRVIAWNYVDVAPDLTVAAVLRLDKLIAENPDLVQGFTEAMNESLAYADATRTRFAQALGTYTKIDAKSAGGADPAEVADRDQQGIGRDALPKLGAAGRHLDERDPGPGQAPSVTVIDTGSPVNPGADRRGGRAPAGPAVLATRRCRAGRLARAPGAAAPDRRGLDRPTCRRPAASWPPSRARRGTGSSGSRSATP